MVTRKIQNADFRLQFQRSLVLPLQYLELVGLYWVLPNLHFENRILSDFVFYYVGYSKQEKVSCLVRIIVERFFFIHSVSKFFKKIL